MMSNASSSSNSRRRSLLQVCFFFFIGTTYYSSAEFLREPTILPWDYALPNGESMVRGNTIVPSRDGQWLYVTTTQGSLHIIPSANNNNKNAQPLSFSRPDESDVITATCQSGIVLLNDEIAVYAVTYDGEEEGTGSSSVLAVNVTDATLVWEVPVPGRIVGTPVLGGRQRAGGEGPPGPPGRALYVAHNSWQGQGQLSVLKEANRNDDDDDDDDENNRSRSGYVLVATIQSPDRMAGPFGPPAIQSIEGMDVVVVAENSQDGYADEGALYILRPVVDDGGAGSGGNYDLITASRRFVRSASAKPLVTADGQVFLGQQGSAISAWVDRNALLDLMMQSNGSDNNIDEVSPRWTQILDSRRGDPDAPIRTTPVVSNDGELVFVASAGQEIECIDSIRGRSVWTQYVTDGDHWTTPIYSSDGQDEVIYFIESSRSIVRQFDAFDGTINWQVDCDDTGASCDASVEADAAISPNGNLLYYGDTDGRIFALRIANFETPAPTSVPTSAPTIAPTSAPSTLVPTLMPTLMLTGTPGTAAPSVNDGAGGDVVDDTSDSEVVGDGDNGSEGGTSDGNGGGDDNEAEEAGSDREVSSGQSELKEGDDDSDDQNILPIIMGAAGGGLLVAILAFLFVSRRKKNNSKGEKQLMKELEANRKWREEKNAYEKACEDAERELMQEILGPDIASTHEKGDKNSKKAKQLMDDAKGDMSPSRKNKQRGGSQKGSPHTSTPQTLTSIEESEGDFDDHQEKDRRKEVDEEKGYEMAVLSSTGKDKHLSPIVKSLDGKFSEFAASKSDDVATSKPQSIPEDTENKVSGGKSTESKGPTESDEENQAPAVPSSSSNDEIKSQTNSSVPLVGAAMPQQDELGDDEDEPGRIVAGARVAAVDEIQDETQSRPTSPSIEVMSIDGSLYLDESTVYTAGTRDFPDDESSRFSALGGATAHSVINDLIPGLGNYLKSSTGAAKAPQNANAPSSTHPGTPRRGPPAIPETEVEREPALPKRTPAVSLEDVKREVVSSMNNIDAPSHRGASVRPARSRAGFLTRRQTPSSSSSPPPPPPPNTTSQDQADLAVEPSRPVAADPSGWYYKAVSSNNKKSRSTTSKKQDGGSTWGSFLNELSKAEEAFFNPRLASSKKKHKQSSSSSKRRDMSPPPPPPSASSPPPPDSPLSVPPPPPSDDDDDDDDDNNNNNADKNNGSYSSGNRSGNINDKGLSYPASRTL